MMPRLLLALLGLLLVGCALPRWYKDGAGQAEFNRDSYECERDARQSGGFGGGLIGLANMQAFQERCLNARGWEKRFGDK